MTVSTTTSRWLYTGDGTSTTFSYTTRIFAASDLAIYVDEVLQATGYSVTGVGSGSGGTVVFATAPAAAAAIVIVRDVPATQTTAYPEGSPFPASSHETALDKLTILVQQVNARLVRCLQLAEADAATSIGRLPDATDRASKYLAFDASGVPIASDAVLTGAVLSTLGEVLATLPSEAAGRSALGLGTAAVKNTGTTDGTIPLIGAGDKLDAALIPSIGVYEDGFDNGDCAIWQRTTDNTAVTTTRTVVCDRWGVTTAAGTLAHVQRSATVPSGVPVRYSMQLDGAAGVTAVRVGQRLEAERVAKIAGNDSFSVYIHNSTGAAFTPKLLISTPAAADDWTTPTIRNGAGSGEDLQSCADGAWTRVTWTGDVTGFVNYANGLEFDIQIPSGSLVAGDGVKLTGWKVQEGAAVSAFKQRDWVREMAQALRFFWKSFLYATAVAQNAGTGGAITWVSVHSAEPAGFCVRFPQPMRGTPAVTFYNPSAANALVRNVDDGADSNGASAAHIGTSGFTITWQPVGGGTDQAGDLMAIHASADAEL